MLLRSRQWYDALASARVLVTNTELEEWYVNRPDQLVLQTFHGYPSKAMGAGPVAGPHRRCGAAGPDDEGRSGTPGTWSSPRPRR